ncbi:hypothetical protein Tco_0815728 [Tanacetum coccineum]
MASTLSRTSLILSIVVVLSYQLCEWSSMTCIDSRACVGVIRGMNPLYEPSVNSSDRAADIGKEDHLIDPAGSLSFHLKALPLSVIGKTLSIMASLVTPGKWKRSTISNTFAFISNSTLSPISEFTMPGLMSSGIKAMYYSMVSALMSISSSISENLQEKLAEYIHKKEIYT